MIALEATLDWDETVSALRGLVDQLPDRVEAAVTKISGYLDDALHDTAPVGKAVPGGRTPGVLRESIQFDQDGLSATFMAASYAGYVIGGTGPHVITGKPTLSFYWAKKGGWVTFARVHHPGTRPNDFRVAALAQAGDQADDEFEALGDWIQQMVG